MTTETEVDIEPGSAAYRAAAHLKANPGTQLDRATAARMFNLAPGAIDRALMPAVDASLLLVAADADAGRMWRAGRLLKHWEPTGTRSPTGIITPATTSKTGVRPKNHKRLPPLKLAGLQVNTGKPLPEDFGPTKGKTKYDEIFDSLKADGMSVDGIDAAYMPALKSASKKYLQHHRALAATSTLVVKRVDQATCGVWRLALATAAAKKVKP